MPLNVDQESYNLPLNIENQKIAIIGAMRSTLQDKNMLDLPRNCQVYMDLCKKEEFTMDFVADAVMKGHSVECCINNLITFFNAKRCA